MVREVPMVKDEIRKITNLVKEGKLSPEDAAELIEAFTKAGGAKPNADANGHAAPIPEPPPMVEEPSVPPPPPVEEPTCESGNETREPGTADPDKDPLRSIIDTIQKQFENVPWDELSKAAKDAAKGVKAEIEKIAKGNWGLFSSQETKEIELPLTIEGKTLRIENPTGTVRVAGKQAVGRVKATARIRGRDAEDAKKKAEAYTLVVEESDSLVLIRQPDMGGLSVDLDVWVTSDTPVEIKTQSGDVSVTDTGGSLKANGQSGDVRVKGLNGPIEINLHSGDLEIVDVKSPTLSIENKTGDILLKNVDANVNARSASGLFSMRNCTGKTVSIESVSGNVFLDLAQAVSGSVSVRTVNGNATVTVEDGSDCRVSLSTLRGSVSCDLELKDDSRVDQRVTGRLGDGSGSIDVSAVNGDIVLRQRDHGQTTVDA
ncbi:MAG: DUF4097 family beta strand repeat protein [Fimbriimonadaceae bacterium]|nr:DUF4097 family beta strand repeat protein [Fimbriimonadaceae bacterium]